MFIAPSFLWASQYPTMHATVCYRTCVVLAILSALPRAITAKGNWNYTNVCRNLPGDPGWPTDEDWSRLNSTIGGRLILGTPLAQSCYLPTLDADACAEVQEEWVLTET